MREIARNLTSALIYFVLAFLLWKLTYASTGGFFGLGPYLFRVYRRSKSDASGEAKPTLNTRQTVQRILLGGAIVELILWWAYESPFFLQSHPSRAGDHFSPDNPFTTPADFANLVPPTHPDWVLSIAAAVSLSTCLAFAFLVLQQVRKHVGQWHGGKLLMLAGGSALVFLLSKTRLVEDWPSILYYFPSAVLVGIASVALVSSVIVPVVATWVWLSARERHSP